jgi:Na+/H+ antiporter NhaD/arsenite permease-like protein
MQFSIQRAQRSTSEQDSAELLVASVREYVTPATDIVALNPDEDAGVAICAMKEAGVRHMVVADPVASDRRLAAASQLLGVVSMQDVMAVLQRDERLSLTSLAKKYPNLSIEDQIRQERIESANVAANEEDVAKRDLIRAASAAVFGTALAAFLSQSSWLHDHADLAMIGIFVAGYVGIIFEEVFEFNKAGVALLMSTGLWITYGDFFQSTGKASGGVIDQLKDQLAEVSDICFFLLAASAIVEVVDAHQGFKAVTDNIRTTSKKALFWIVGFLTFFLSSILNNLTVTIVMVSLLRKLIPNVDDRKLFGAMVVVAANAGGVWTPIGDVTTTMLWINNQLSTIPTVTELFLPSVVCLVASLAFLVNQVEEDGSLDSVVRDDTPVSRRGQIVFWTGIASLLSVPVFNELTGLPPYLAMLTGLGVIWTLTDVIHLGEEEGEQLKVPAALARLDTAGILFFLGILMSIGVLDKSGLLKELAVFLSDNLPSQDIIATVIGLASALIDNVPLVAATMGMYDLTEFGTDDKLWQLIALCAGTGGSILVIGSASGVALMGLEKVDFLWYAKKVTIGATVGYFAGIATYLAQYAVLNGGLLSGLLPQAAVAADVLQQGAAGLVI